MYVCMSDICMLINDSFPRTNSAPIHNIMEVNKTNFHSNQYFDQLPEINYARSFSGIVHMTNRGFRMVILPILLVVGIIGQLFAVKIFVTMKKWKSTCKIYYSSMACADLVYLIWFGIPEWTGEGLDMITDGALKFRPETISTFTCRTFRYLWHLSWFISNWLLVVYSVERVIAISYPMFRVRYINLKSAKITCIIVAMTGIVTFLPVLLTEAYHLYRESSKSPSDCNFNTASIEDPFLIIWLAIFPTFLTMFLPPCLLVVINLVLLFKMKSQSNEREKLAHKPIGCKNVRESTQNLEIKAAKDLAVISFVTLVIASPTLLWIPTLIMECMPLLLWQINYSRENSN